MRQYIRHPSDIPITYSLGGTLINSKEPLKDLSQGGLCFKAQDYIDTGIFIHIEIPTEDMPFEAEGLVVWCKPSSDDYEVGVQFNDRSTEFSVRMVEQICHIEQYKHTVSKTEGRDLSGEQAAAEWIAKHAKDFPG